VVRQHRLPIYGVYLDELTDGVVDTIAATRLTSWARSPEFMRQIRA
jgi:hypothetical protein